MSVSKTSLCEDQAVTKASYTMLIHRFVTDLNNKNIDEIISWFSESTTVWIPPADPVSGRRRLRILFTLIFKKYRSLHFSIQMINEVISKSGKLIVEMQTTGELVTGLSVENDVLSIIQFDHNNMISTISDYFKDTSFLHR